jgi:hypothetical protein
MRLSPLLLAIFRFLLPPTLIGLAYIYFYPALYQCSFPPARPAEAACRIPGSEKEGRAAETAPFRLLALADPQLEGGSSLVDWSERGVRRWWDLWQATGFGEALVKGVGEDAALVVKDVRKRVDLWGNDLYLGHTYRTMHWWSRPSHVVVLGDLLGSQWIGKDEFENRSRRFWNKVFKGAEKVPQSITGSSGRVEVLGNDETWRHRIIAVAGNHDIGYAGDINEDRIERFEKRFGDVNWEIRFRLENASATHAPSPLSNFGSPIFLAQNAPPELRLIVLNSMNLDEPAYSPLVRERSLDFLSTSITDPTTPPTEKTGTILLTHIPLHKAEGVCVDSPYFSYFPTHQGGGIREQNHLSNDVSSRILDGLTQAGSAIVLNGHDHEGCDTLHTKSDPWNATKYDTSHPAKSQDLPALRELTVRSMMGEFSGNAGMLSAWFDPDHGRWQFAYQECRFGVQHIWWAGHILALIELGVGVAGLVLGEMEGRESDRKQKTA